MLSYHVFYLIFYAFLVEFRWFWVVPKPKKTKIEKRKKSTIVSWFLYIMTQFWSNLKSLNS